ncbi:chloride channel protein [Cupriavidus sp. CP313]
MALSMRSLAGTARACWFLWPGVVLVGAVAVLYAWAMVSAHAAMMTLVDAFPSALLVIMPAAGAACVWITRRWFVGAEGSGVPQTIAALDGDLATQRWLLSWRLLLGKVGLSVLATAAGFPIGRQGPTIYLGAVIMHEIRARVPLLQRRSASEVSDRQWIALGGAAGLAAAFHTPLAGVTFALEQLLVGEEIRGRTVALLLMATFAAVAVPLLAASGIVAPQIPPGIRDGQLVMAVLLTGAATGLAGAGFAWMLVHSTRWLPVWLAALRAARPVIFGAACGLFVALLAMSSRGRILESAEQVVHRILEGGEFFPVEVCARWLALLATAIAGIPGGVFVPSVSIGAGIGEVLHQIMNSVDVQVFVTLSMAGYLAALTRGPFTACVVAIELSGSLRALFPILATCLLAAWISASFAPPLYRALSISYKGESAPKRGGHA